MNRENEENLPEEVEPVVVHDEISRLRSSRMECHCCGCSGTAILIIILALTVYLIYHIFFR